MEDDELPENKLLTDPKTGRTQTLGEWAREYAERIRKAAQRAREGKQEAPRGKN
jgi:hypothetical protein